MRKEINLDQILNDLQSLSSFEKPLNSKWFRNKYGIDKRTLTFLIEKIRNSREDILIGSSTKGYYIVKTQVEAKYYRHFIYDRALNILSRYNRDKKIINKLFPPAEQISLEM